MYWAGRFIVGIINLFMSTDGKIVIETQFSTTVLVDIEYTPILIN